MCMLAHFQDISITAAAASLEEEEEGGNGFPCRAKKAVEFPQVY